MILARKKRSIPMGVSALCNGFSEKSFPGAKLGFLIFQEMKTFFESLVIFLLFCCVVWEIDESVRNKCSWPHIIINALDHVWKICTFLATAKSLERLAQDFLWENSQKCRNTQNVLLVIGKCCTYSDIALYFRYSLENLGSIEKNYGWIHIGKTTLSDEKWEFWTVS